MENKYLIYEKVIFPNLIHSSHQYGKLERELEQLNN